MNIKNNARGRASCQALRQALLELLESQELPQITIAQLCRQAGVNRSTFYAHYENIGDLLNELEEEMDSTLLSQFRWVRDMDSAMLDRRSFLIVTRHIATYPAFFRARLHNPSMQTGRLKAGMNWLMEEVVGPYARARNDSPLLPYYMAFGRAGIFEVLGLWIDRNCAEAPEEIAQLLHQMAIGDFI